MASNMSGKMLWIKFSLFILSIQQATGTTEYPLQKDNSYLPTFKKCKCSKDQAESLNLLCIPSNNTKILMWDEASGAENPLDLRNYGNVITQPLICPEGLSKIVYHDFALFLSDGKLFVSSAPPTDLYCIENTFDEVNGPIHRIEVCLPKMNVPLCCEKDEFLSAKDTCIFFHTNEMFMAHTRWPEGFDYYVDTPKCKGQSFPSNEIVGPSLFHALEFRDLVSHFNSVYNGSFCIAIQGASTLGYLIRHCNNSCVGASCLPSCCPLNYVYDMETHGCIPHGKMNQTFHQLIEGIPDDVIEISSQMRCTDRGILTISGAESYEFLTNSSLVTIPTGTDNPVILEPKQYCLGNLLFSNGSVKPAGLLCLNFESAPDTCTWRWMIIRVMLIISSVFILATLVVYLGVPDLRRRIQGACLISELVALLISQINLVILQLNQTEFSPDGCLAAGVIEIIFILASFFWLNVICYDVWSTFRKVRPFNETSLDKRIFSFYSLYAWGIPVIVGIIVVIVEKTEAPLRPSFNHDLYQGCFFNSQDIASQWVYMYSIILLLLLINCCFFSHLAIRLLPQLAQRKALKGTSSKGTVKQNEKDRENMKLYLKLFIIMGLPWLLEVFSSLASSKDVQCYIWIIDIVNLLRGVFIFVIFVFKESTRQKIVAAWCTFPQAQATSTSDDRSRKTSVMSLNSWLPSITRKLSKTSNESAGALSAQMGGMVGPASSRIPEEEEDEDEIKVASVEDAKC